MEKPVLGEVWDAVVVGGGIVGAATFYKLQARFPSKRILLLEKEAVLSNHQTGHNSGVIHSGIYYKPGSKKAKTCVQGRRELVAFARQHGIKHDVCGKVIVAVEQGELPQLDKIYERGIANGIEDLRRISAEEIKAAVPNLCRCGVYPRLVRAIQRAGRMMRRVETISAAPAPGLTPQDAARTVPAMKGE